MKLSFLGDVMLGRFVRDKWQDNNYSILSEQLIQYLHGSDYVVANLESPITDIEPTNSLAFAGDKRLLSQCRWVNCFSLSNNHINDFGEQGIEDTIKNLELNDISSNGIFVGEYKPLVIEKENNRIAIVTCTDTLNYKFEPKCRFKTLRVDSPKVNRIIKEYKENGYFVILFAHCGNLFSRFPNPLIRDLLHSAIDSGAGCVITSHSHCLGGMDSYKEVPIFYSLGDFLMDGGSYRRRRSCILTLDVEYNNLEGWDVVPTMTNEELQTMLADEKAARKIKHDFDEVSRKMQVERRSYEKFFKYQYKKEMIYHSLSTLHFLYDSKGLSGFYKMMKVRYRAVFRMIHRMIFDRSKERNDGDGIKIDHMLKMDDIR